MTKTEKRFVHMSSIILISIFYLIFIGSSYAAEWLVVGESQQGYYSYDIESVKDSNKGIYTFWMNRYARTMEQKTAYLNHLRQYGLYHPQMDQWKNVMLQGQVDCKNKAHRFLSSADYGLGGNVLSSSDFTHHGTPRWEAIYPESVSNTLYSYLCVRNYKLLNGRSWIPRKSKVDDINRLKYDYYDRANMSSVDKSIVRVWTKSYITESDKTSELEILNNTSLMFRNSTNMQARNNFEQYKARKQEVIKYANYRISAYELNCKNMIAAHILECIYDYSGEGLECAELRDNEIPGLLYIVNRNGELEKLACNLHGKSKLKTANKKAKM